MRTNESFRLNKDQGYHKAPTSLEYFPIDLASTVVMNYMHCICLDVIKSELTFWIKRKKPVKFKCDDF